MNIGEKSIKMRFCNIQEVSSVQDVQENLKKKLNSACSALFYWFTTKQIIAEHVQQKSNIHLTVFLEVKLQKNFKILKIIGILKYYKIIILKF